jgi:hypothetical protein
MKAKLVVEGKEFDIEILDPKLQELIAPKKKTGYEKVAKANDTYYFDNGGGYLNDSVDPFPESENNAYKAANYYTSKQVAENNVRADKLMRQLRRFAVEYNESVADWGNNQSLKYQIYYSYKDSTLTVNCAYSTRLFGGVTFSSKDVAELAVKTFKDELIWYFTEYRDSL